MPSECCCGSVSVALKGMVVADSIVLVYPSPYGRSGREEVLLLKLLDVWLVDCAVREELKYHIPHDLGIWLTRACRGVRRYVAWSLVGHRWHF